MYVKNSLASDGEIDTATSGTFKADVSLMANFGGDDVAVNKQYSIEGSASNFVLSGGEENAWSVNLKADFGSTNNEFTGTADGGGAEAAWNATFYGAPAENTPDGRAKVAPPSLAGEFNVNFLERACRRRVRRAQAVELGSTKRTPAVRGRSNTKDAGRRPPGRLPLLRKMGYTPPALFGKETMYKSVMPGRNGRERVREYALHTSHAMKKIILLIICITFIGLSHLTAGEAFAARSHLSKDPKVQAARGLLKQRRYIEAFKILHPIARESKGRADRTDVLFLFSLSAIEASRRLPPAKAKERTALLDAAIAALRAILIEKPALVRVRLELARAFFYKQEDDLSRRHFDRVLAGKPPKAMVSNINRFLRIMRARRRWSAHFGFSIAPDTNIGAVSGSEIIYIYDLPFRRNEFEGESSGLGFVFWGGWEYQHPLGERLRMRLGANISRREYEGEPLRSNDGLPPRRAALVDKSQHRDEPARQRAPAQKRRPHPQPRVRRALRTRTPPHAPHPSERARFLARARLRNQ